MSFPNRFRQGFTLVEALMATALLGVVVLSVGGLFLHGLRVHTDTEEAMRATNILRQEADAMRARVWKSDATAAGTLVGVHQLGCGVISTGEAIRPEGGKVVSRPPVANPAAVTSAECVTTFTPLFDYRAGASVAPAAAGLINLRATRKVRLLTSVASLTEADRAEVELRLDWGAPDRPRSRTANLTITRDGLASSR